jgi:SET domain-containing protein
MDLYTVAPSQIHGRGVIATRDLARGEMIGLAIKLYMGIVPSITSELGMWLNHSEHPNALFLWEPRYGGFVVRLCAPLKAGSEIVVNYRVSPWYDVKSLDGPPTTFRRGTGRPKRCACCPDPECCN